MFAGPMRFSTGSGCGHEREVKIAVSRNGKKCLYIAGDRPVTYQAHARYHTDG
jgi:hypothetical protein